MKNDITSLLNKVKLLENMAASLGSFSTASYVNGKPVHSEKYIYTKQEDGDDKKENLYKVVDTLKKKKEKENREYLRQMYGDK